jgi:hypothetical protein
VFTGGGGSAICEHGRRILRRGAAAAVYVSMANKTTCKGVRRRYM